MTARATFGDFIRAAHWHLDSATTIHGPPGLRGSAEEVSRSLLRVITVMRRYVDEMTAGFPRQRQRPRSALPTWPGAAVEVRAALASAAGFLNTQGAASRWPAVPAVSPLARRLDAVAESLITGHDLLQTHFVMDRNGGRQHRSEWALIITSPMVMRALLAEFATLSHTIARHGVNIALAGAPGRQKSAGMWRALNAACQWLWVLSASIQEAHQREPWSVADGELLHSIPANVAPPRCLPDGSESVAALCEGTITTAERLRHLAWDAVERARWSSAMSVTSMYQVAAANTVTSHNSEVLLRAVAARTAHPQFGQISAQLSTAADAARRTREAWLSTAHALDDVNTDAEGRISRAAAETRDLALWTGRLSYANPDWTLASGPAQIARTPESLAPGPEQVPPVIAAVHQVSATLTRLARVELEQIRAAAQAGRILVPTRSLPSEFDIPRPFARALPAHVERLLSHYREAAYASQQISAAIEPAAEATRAPSRMLTAAAAALGHRHVGAHEKDKVPNDFASAAPDLDADDRPGPVERTLRQFGGDRPDVLRRGAKIDQAGSQLIIDAANELAPRHRPPSAAVLNRSAGAAEVVNHALASGDPRAAALLRHPAQPEREPPEPEP
jgi:hypothetical protein